MSAPELPESPTGVRLVLPSGDEVPCRLKYVGLNDDRCHVWWAYSPIVPPLPVEPGQPRAILRVAKFPPRTTIMFAVAPGAIALEDADP